MAAQKKPKPEQNTKFKVLDWEPVSLFSVEQQPSHQRFVKQAVLLHHGIDMSADSWLHMDDPSSLNFPIPIQLWHAGYDVWLANNRGVSHSQGHAYFDLERDANRYWDFSFTEIGLYDIPAMVKQVKKTLQDDHFYDEFYHNIDQVLYLGYDQGANAMLYSLAKQEKRLLPDVSAVVLLAPCAKMNVEKSKTGMTFFKQIVMMSEVLGLQVLTGENWDKVRNMICAHIGVTWC